LPQAPAVGESANAGETVAAAERTYSTKHCTTAKMKADGIGKLRAAKAQPKKPRLRLVAKRGSVGWLHCRMTSLIGLDHCDLTLE
jgi:hypothetical protein